MNIFDVLSQVESPFTDEEIINLTKKFIECNCDVNEFYRSINIDTERKDNPYLTELYTKLFSLSNIGTRYVDENDFWKFVASSKDTLSVPDEIEKRVPIYRIYLNAKGQDKARIVEEYIKKCESAGLQFNLKYAVKDGRDDEILIKSYGENLARNIELVEEITEGMQLGEPAKLTGKYKGRIGIGEEYIQASIYSYTETRLGIIPIIMEKYCIEHKQEFYEYLNDSNKELVDSLLISLRKKSDKLIKKIASLSEGDEKSKEELKRKQFAYANNIDLDTGIQRMNDSICEYMPEEIKKYISDNLEKAMPEIIKNYRLACEIFGISRNGVFSQRTEEILQQQQRTPLQIREAELSALEAEEKTISEAEALIKKEMDKKGKDIGE